VYCLAESLCGGNSVLFSSLCMVEIVYCLAKSLCGGNSVSNPETGPGSGVTT
jgi:hypothetical protein